MLPEKWFIKITKENMAFFKEYRGATCYPNYCLEYKKGAMGDLYHLDIGSIHKDAKEITFEDFEREILKKEVYYELY